MKIHFCDRQWAIALSIALTAFGCKAPYGGSNAQETERAKTEVHGVLNTSALKKYPISIEQSGVVWYLDAVDVPGELHGQAVDVTGVEDRSGGTPRLLKNVSINGVLYQTSRQWHDEHRDQDQVEFIDVDAEGPDE